MDNKKLENKAEPKKRTRKPKEVKVSDKYIVIKEFCGIAIGQELTITDKGRQLHMTNQGYVKIKA